MTPHPGQIVIVRNRPAIVKDISKSKTHEHEAVHGVWVDYIDGYTHPENDFIVWERELHARIIKGATLPDVAGGIDADRPDIFHTFINCYRWTSNNSIHDLSFQSIGHLKLISPWYSAVQIEDYQLFPVLKAFTMPRITLLLADDVGLGKTIEAGLILNELIARGRLRRILIICPAALQVQWRDEMQEKFYLDFTIVDRESTYKLQKEFGVDSNPWSSYPRIITSIDYLRQRDVLQNFQSATESFTRDNHAMMAWDMLIIDEAHNISSRYFGVDTERLKMIKQVVPHFENRLFLTATPHNGYTESFTGLLEQLNPLVFEQKRVLEGKDFNFIENYVVRRLKSDFIEDGILKKFTRRSIHRIDPEYSLTHDERELYSAVGEYKNVVMKLVSDEAGTKRMIVSFLISLLTKRLLSSTYSFALTWWNHFAGWEIEEIDEGLVKHAIERAQADLTDDEERDIRQDEVAQKIGSWLYQHADKLRPQIEHINAILKKIGWSSDILSEGIENNNKLPDDSKWDSLLNWIEKKLKNKDKFKNDERVIIFTEYKHTLDYLLRRFDKIGITEPIMETLFGGSSQSKREEIKQYFNDGESPLRILLATDVASEGINLQNNCRYVIHYEIPWNPMRLEQRNGRVDRFGQIRDVEVFHFVSDEEDDLKFLERVVNKVEQIREDLGSVGELLDKNIENYFLGEVLEQENAAKYLDEINPELTENEDLSSSDSGTRDEYEKSIRLLKSAEINLDLNSANLAQLLTIAFDIEGGELSPHHTDEGVYEIKKIPPRWKNVINESLKIQSGRFTGALYKLVFDPGYFEKSVNGRLIYLNKTDAKLIRLGHPLMKRAIGMLKRKLWENTGVDGSGSLLSRFTIQKSEFPHGIDGMVVLYLLVEANNELRERIHEEVLIIPKILKGDSIGSIEDELWKSIKDKPRERLTQDQLKKWMPFIQDKWLTLEDQLKDVIIAKKKEIQKQFEQIVEKGFEDEKNHTEERYNQRLMELKEKRGSKYINRLKNQLEKERTKLQQRALFENIEKERIDKVREIEINIEKIQTQRINYLETVLKDEKERLIKSVLPRRFNINNLDVHPLGVEIILNKHLVDKSS